MKLYHATFKSNEASILKNGLERFHDQNFEGMTMNECIYFAFDVEAAVSFVESSDTYENVGEEIIVFEVDSKDLDIKNITYDWNNLCEHENEITSIAYNGDVSADCLHLMSKEEIKQAEFCEFSDLKHLDDSSAEIWEKIGTIFDEEVETNKDIEERE